VSTSPMPHDLILPFWVSVCPFSESATECSSSRFIPAIRLRKKHIVRMDSLRFRFVSEKCDRSVDLSHPKTALFCRKLDFMTPLLSATNFRLGIYPIYSLWESTNNIFHFPPVLHLYFLPSASFRTKMCFFLLFPWSHEACLSLALGRHDVVALRWNGASTARFIDPRRLCH
jgi:hypothetical protein